MNKTLFPALMCFCLLTLFDTDSGWADQIGETAKIEAVVNTYACQEVDNFPAMYASSNGVVSTKISSLSYRVAAMLLVFPPPAISLDPVNTTVCQGAPVNFTAAATGSPVPTVQWQSNAGSGWADIPGKTQTTLDLPSTLPVWNGYQFRAVFTNSGGTSMTAAATLTVNLDPVVTTNPDNATACESGSVVFMAAASGQPTPTVQWQLDDGNGWGDISGETNLTLNLNNVITSMNGDSYRAVFTNSCNSAATAPATLTVNEAPEVVHSPADVAVCEGSSITYSVAATGTPAPTIQWQVNDGNGWSDLSGETGVMLDVSNIAANLNGSLYRAVLTNSCGSATTLEATLTVWTEAEMSVNLADEVVCEGADATFTAIVGGFPVPAVQWQVNDGNGWADLNGATSTNLTIVAASASQNDYHYRIVLTNNCGIVTSNSAVLTVNTPPVISSDPQDITINHMGTAAFTVGFVAQPAAYIQWQIYGQQSWINLYGENNPTLTLTNVPSGWHGDLYRAVLTNGCGSVESQSATLNVNPSGGTANSDTFIAVIVPEPPSLIQLPDGDCALGCIPDVGDPDDGSGPTYTSDLMVQLENAAGAEFLIKYQKRTCRDAAECFVDYRISEIVYLGAYGQDPYAGYRLSCLLEDVKANFLLAAEAANSSSLGLVNCSTVRYRVIHSKCWERVNVGNPLCPIEYRDCGEGSSCCVSMYYFSPNYIPDSLADNGSVQFGFSVVKVWDNPENEVQSCDDASGTPVPVVGCEDACSTCDTIDQDQ